MLVDIQCSTFIWGVRTYELWKIVKWIIIFIIVRTSNGKTIYNCIEIILSMDQYQVSERLCGLCSKWRLHFERVFALMTPTMQYSGGSEIISAMKPSSNLANSRKMCHNNLFFVYADSLHSLRLQSCNGAACVRLKTQSIKSTTMTYFLRISITSWIVYKCVSKYFQFWTEMVDWATSIMHLCVPYIIRMGFQNSKLAMENDHGFAYLEQMSSSNFPYSNYHGAQIFDSIINRD